MFSPDETSISASAAPHYGGPFRETFIKRYIVERTTKAEIKQEESSQKAENCQEILWNGIQLKVPQRQKQTREQNKNEWASSVGLLRQGQTATSPPREGEPPGTYVKQKKKFHEL